MRTYRHLGSVDAANNDKVVNDTQPPPDEIITTRRPTSQKLTSRRLLSAHWLLANACGPIAQRCYAMP
jgi:hypothetical protein